MNRKQRAIKDGKRREYSLPRMQAAVRTLLREMDGYSIHTLNSDAARPVHIAADAGMADTRKIGRYCPHHTSNPDVAFIAEVRKWVMQGERLLMRADALGGSAKSEAKMSSFIWSEDGDDEETDDNE